MTHTNASLIVSKSKYNFDLLTLILPVGLIGLTIYLVLFDEFDVSDTQFYAILGLIAITIYYFVKKIRYRIQIVIDNSGIKLFEENKIFIWKEIKYFEESGKLIIQ